MQAEPDMIQQALRMYLSERTNDCTSKEMLAELHTAAISQEGLDHLLEEFKHDPDILSQAALVYFEYAWEDDTERPSIRAAFEYAKDRLPVVEITILAIAAMYGMYLLTTKGVTKIERTTKKNPDGSYETIERIEKEPFAPIVSAITQMFKKPGP